ncbi:MAG TPA: beta-1,3-glucanase family protein, partial [Gemmataceae bacterium]|nr:beta-1,3-glucanase family protein [Gemmataceae bacterium]
FDKYIDDVWEHYSIDKKTPSGKWIGKVTDGALTFTPVGGGKPIKCERKPTTQEAFLGSGVLATNPQFCAAINRHLLADPADWNNPEAFYKAEPCNWYAKFFHEHGIDKKAYGFCYDDVTEQAAFYSGKGKEVIITLHWDGVSPKR